MIVGVDFSLTATGVCAITDGEAECVTIRSKKEELWHEFPARVAGIGLDLEAWLGPGSEPLFVVESPAFGARSAALDRLFGGWWMFVDTLVTGCAYEPPILVTPSQLKKFATNKGNAGKDEVLAAVIRRYPDVLVTGNDQADALVLAAIGAAVMGEPFNQALTKAQGEVVESVRERGGIGA